MSANEPLTLHEELTAQYRLLKARLHDPLAQNSYTAYLYREGLDKILKKCGEETFEAVIAAKNEDPAELAGELNDVLYHVTVLLCFANVRFEAVTEALARRCRLADADCTVEAAAAVIEERRQAGAAEASKDKDTPAYTAYLFASGLDKVLKKVGEACALLMLAAKNSAPDAIAAETADLLYHLLVMMNIKGLSCQALAAELAARRQKTGNLKTTHSTDLNS